MFNAVPDARFGRFADELAGLVHLLTDNDALTSAHFNAVIKAGSREFDLLTVLSDLERPLVQLHKARGGTCSTCG